MKGTVEALVAESLAFAIPEFTRRDAVLPAIPGKADAVIGMRRSGKTYLLYQHMAALLEAGLPRSSLLYLDFEDERLMPMSAADLHHVPEALDRRHPERIGAERWLLLDEIQNVPGWERFVRRMLGVAGVRVALSGSSAKLLSTEIATSLRGRALSTTLYPFSFREFLSHHGVRLPDKWPPAPAARAKLEHAFSRYLELGGFPEVQSLRPDLRVRVLQEYVDVTLLRDVVERYGASNVPALRYLIRRFLENQGGRFSVNRLYNDLRSMGTPVAKDTLHAYLQHLEDAFLLFAIPVASESARVRAVNPRKGYVIDHGLARASSLKASADLGHALENIVFIELRRRGFDLAYVSTKGDREVDFLATSRRGEAQLVQVSASLTDPKTRARELAALEAGMALCGIDSGVIVTLGETDDLEVTGGQVSVRPAWRWLLEAQEQSGHEAS